nr:MAG TPA: hypothetical protein [Caudoviricetes sp.]
MYLLYFLDFCFIVLLLFLYIFYFYLFFIYQPLLFSCNFSSAIL